MKDDIKKLASDIASRGVSSVFGITGSGATLTLLDELEQVGVTAVRTHFEGSAALMAGTVGRITGKAGIAFGIKGPGFANMIPGLAACWLEAFPMVAVVEAYPPGSTADKAHKRLDHAALSKAVTKGRRCLTAHDAGFADMATWSEREVPGPVVLELTGGNPPFEPASPGRQLSEGTVDDVISLVEKAKRPLVIAGTLAVRRGWHEHLARLGVPVFSTAAAKGVIDESSTMAAGVYTGVGLGLTPETRLLAEADVVVGLGLRPNELLATRPFPCTAVNIDPVVVPGVEAFRFAATTPEATDRLWQVLCDRQWGQDALQDALSALHRTMRADFLPGQAFAIIAECLGSDIRMVMDTGYFCTIGEHAWQAPRADLCLLSGQGRYMGTVVPMAIAAAIHDTATPVVAVAGDGGIGMYIGELRLACERKLPLLLVLMTDGRFGSIATRAINEGLSRTALEIPDPTWVSIMTGVGVPSWRTSTPEGLYAALAAWRPMEGPAYLEIAFDPDKYQNMCDNIR